MELIKAKTMGYCMGVKRAVDIVKKALADFPNKQVFTLGPLIHNEQALNALKEQGVRILSEKDINSECNENTVVVIRAHGVSPLIIDKLQQKNCLIINATCPRVLSNQKKISEFASKHYTIYIAGDKNHGEVLGLEGITSKYTDKCKVIQNAKEAENFIFSLSDSEKKEKSVLLSQTTISIEEYKLISEILTKNLPELTILNTICPATMDRQKALIELCSETNAVIVIGGKYSANTCRLYNTAKTLSLDSMYKCEYVCHIETIQELPDEIFRFQKVGLTAGASTPDEVILQVQKALQKN